MANKDLSLKPHFFRATKEVWWYEEGQGLAIEIAPCGCRPHREVKISWRSIRAALERKERGDG